MQAQPSCPHVRGGPSFGWWPPGVLHLSPRVLWCAWITGTAVGNRRTLDFKRQFEFDSADCSAD